MYFSVSKSRSIIIFPSFLRAYRQKRRESGFIENGSNHTPPPTATGLLSKHFTNESSIISVPPRPEEAASKKTSPTRARPFVNS